MTVIEDKYLSKVAAVTPQSARLTFRGLADSRWSLHSGATRRILQELYDQGRGDQDRSLTFGRLFLSYHRSVLLEPARNYGFDSSNGIRDSDLQMLSKLQHFGAATGLLDFTRDAIVALWFATNAPEGRECSGKVVVVNINDGIHYRQFTLHPDEQTLANIFPLASDSQKRQFYWEPRSGDMASARVLRQRSIFVIGLPTGPEVSKGGIAAEITIAAEDKKTIRGELERLFGVSEQSLFPDIQGFARANSQSTAIARLNDPDYFESQGSELYQRGEYERSIVAYDECVQLDPQRWMAFYLRGNAKAQSGDLRGANEDYSEALGILRHAQDSTGQATPQYRAHTLFALFNRGNVNYALRRYEEACVDYLDAIPLLSYSHQGSLHYNLANAKAKLGKFDDALTHFDIAIKNNVRNARFNKGNSLVALGRFQEALRCYLEEHEIHNDDKTKNNIAVIRSVLERIGGSECVVASFEKESVLLGSMPCVIVFENEEARSSEDLPLESVGTTFLCTGNAGNVGNYGGDGTKGGDGLEGENGFGLKITW